MFDDFQDMDEGQEGEALGSYTPEEPEGLAPPRQSSLCLGHEPVEESLLSLINSGAMPHALIFSGAIGIGKSTLAFRLARYLLKHGTTDNTQDSLFGEPHLEATSLDIPTDDPIFSQVSSGGHPDLLTIERPMDVKKGVQKDHLNVAEARKVAPFLRMTAADGGWRVVVIDDADTMNRNAQNALLKILEEPPANAILILITHRLGSMIPTIRSRCRTLHFYSLEKETLTALMKKEIGTSLPSFEQEILASMSEGSIGLAQKIIESGGLETAQKILTLFERWPNFNWVDIHHLCETAARPTQAETFKNIEKTFLWITENLVFSKAKGKGALSAPLHNDIFTKMLNHYSLEETLKICENLKEHFRQAHHSNLDKKQAVLGAFNILSTPS